MSDERIMPMEKRDKIHRKARSKCAEACREVGAKFAYMLIAIEGNGGLHLVDAYTGEGVPNMGDLLRNVASGHDAQAQHREAGHEGDVGYRQ